MKKVFSIIGALIIIALIFGVVYFLYIYTGEFSTDFKTFYVEIHGKKYVKNNYEMTLYNPTRINVHYTFEKIQTNKPTFFYNIEPAGVDFNIKVDGEKISWLNVGELTAAFNVKEDKDGITLDCTNKTLLDVLQIVYPKREIELPEVDERQPHFKMTFTSEDKKSSVAITFSAPKTVSDVTLDNTEIIF